MAKIIIPAIPYSVVAVDTNENVLGIAYPSIERGVTVRLTVTVGTFKFNVLGDAADSNLSVTVAGTYTVKIFSGSQIRFKATTIDDAFTVETL